MRFLSLFCLRAFLVNRGQLIRKPLYLKEPSLFIYSFVLWCDKHYLVSTVGKVHMNETWPISKLPAISTFFLSPSSLTLYLGLVSLLQCLDSRPFLINATAVGSMIFESGASQTPMHTNHLVIHENEGPDSLGSGWSHRDSISTRLLGDTTTTDPSTRLWIVGPWSTDLCWVWECSPRIHVHQGMKHVTLSGNRLWRCNQVKMSRFALSRNTESIFIFLSYLSVFREREEID